MNANPPVSVVLATYHRGESLRRCLAAVAAQAGAPEFEVVVVDNDPGGSGRAVSATSALGERVRYVVEPTPGSAAARNRAIAEARGDVVVITDDDVEAEPGWLAALIAPILAGRADATGGPVRLDPTVARPRWLDERVVGGYLTNFALDRPAGELAPREWLVTANFACRAELLRRSGGFLASLGPRGRLQLVGDDVQVVRAVQRAGGRVHYVPDAVVVHELPPARLRRAYLLRRAYAQGRSDWILDHDQLAARRLNGARVALSWLGGQLRARWREGWWSRPEVRFHAVCDLVRTAGSLAEAARWAAGRHPAP